MKKIKGLLFGILTLLGIGSSFSQFFEVNDSTGTQLIIPNIYYSYDDYTDYLYFNFNYGDSLYNSSSVEVTRFTNVDYLKINGCTNSNGVYKGFSSLLSFGDNSDCSTSPLVSDSFLYLYMSSSTSNSPYSVRQAGEISSYIYFDSDYIYSNYGYKKDVPDGYTRQNIFLNNVGNYGFVSNDGNDNFLLSSIGQDSFNISDLGGGLYDFDLDVYIGFLILHFNDYSSSYYTGNSTIVLQFGSGEILYNFYTGYYGGIQEISSENIIPYQNGYLTYNGSTGEAYSYFISNVLNKGNIILTNGSYLGGIVFTSYSHTYVGLGIDMPRPRVTSTTTTSFQFLSDDNVATIITGSSSNLINISGSNTASLYYNCLGPTYNTIDGLPPAYCYDESGSLNAERFLNCFVSYDVISSGYISTIDHIFCNIDGYLQEVVLEESGSGYSIVPGTNTTESVLSFYTGDSIYSANYFENYLNSTGLFFKCPWTYDNNLVVWPKLITFLNGVDIALPINCVLAGFNHGKDVLSFNNSGHFLEIPLLNFEGDNRSLLYMFFDIILSFGLVFFAGKLFYLFNK